ncbi:DUF4194 domain-containing protein [Gordonibacter sp.]|uniref:DUF4194 domain-containing protein n=1 Tax=Gordonibacter sp. TaxID=1968902 RepID=UPI002FC7C9AD
MTAPFDEQSPTLPEEDIDENVGLWPGDLGTLELDARRALLQLVRGPMITADANKDLWRALLNDRPLIASRLADLFLVLVVKEDDGIAFAQNAPAPDTRIPKAVRSQPLTLIDTILVLMLRRELVGSVGRTFVGREETYGTLAQYRPLAKIDEAAFRKKLDSSWNKLVINGMLLKTDTPERFEVSPVLKLIFSVEDAEAVNAAFDELLEDAAKGHPHDSELLVDDQRSEEEENEDDL